LKLKVTLNRNTSEQVSREAIATQRLELLRALMLLELTEEALELSQAFSSTDISVSAVKGRLHKSRHQLRKQLSVFQDRIQPKSFQDIKTMTNDASVQTKPELCCSFCHKSSEQVELLIAGPAGVFICNGCVDICNQIIRGEFL
jgi:hypothetical protein